MDLNEGFAEFLIKGLVNLLYLFEPLSGNIPVNISRVKINPEKKRTAGKSHRISYISPECFKRNSPLLHYFIRSFSLLMACLECYDDKNDKLFIDGIRIRDNRTWESPSDKNPNDIMAYISGKCNIKCDFCYLKGNPPHLNNLNRNISHEEIVYRLGLFARGKRVLPRNILSTDEQTTNPFFLTAIRKIREVTTSPVFIETNGINLNSELIGAIKEIKGLYMNLSVNILDHGLRKSMLKDKNPARVKKNLRLLYEAGVSYSVSVVPWYKVPLKELGNIICFCDNINVSHIRVRLPGHTSFFSGKRLFDMDHLWHDIIDYIGNIRESVSVPIITEPNKYEQLLIDKYYRYPLIMGVIKNSPAYFAKIQYNDYILKVNNTKMLWRNDAIKHLLINFMSRKDIKLTVLRDGTQHEIILYCRPDKNIYPYDPSDSRCPYGLFVSNDIDWTSIMNIKGLIDEKKINKAVLISSRLMIKSIESILSLFNLEGLYEKMDIKVIPNKYFGGNIFMGDLLVADDIIDYFQGPGKASSNLYDCIFLPSSMFNPYGYDIKGDNYKKIEYILDKKVELLYSRIISL